MNSQAQTYFAVGPRLPRPAPPRRTAAALAGALPDKSGSVFKDRPRRRKMPPPRIRAAPGSVPDVQSRPGRLRRVGSKLAKTPPPSQPPFFNFFSRGAATSSPHPQGSGNRVRGSGFRARGSGFGVQGSGFRDPNPNPNPNRNRLIPRLRAMIGWPPIET